MGLLFEYCSGVVTKKTDSGSVIRTKLRAHILCIPSACFDLCTFLHFNVYSCYKTFLSLLWSNSVFALGLYFTAFHYLC